MSLMDHESAKLTGTTKGLLLAILAVAFAFRLSLNVVFQGLDSAPDPALGSDHVEYDQLARNLLAGNGYRLYPGTPPTAFRPPGTPFILAGIYAVCGTHYAAVRVTYSLLGALTCVFLFSIARRFVSTNWSLTAAAVLALDPSHAYYSMHLFSEVPWTLLITLAVLVGLKCMENDRTSWAVLQGLLLGFASLTRPVALLYPFLQAFLALITPPARRWKLIIIPTVVMFAVIFPWSMRNRHAIGEFSLVSTQGGQVFYGGNNEVVLANRELTGRWILPGMLPKIAEIHSAGNEVDRDRKGYELGQEFLRAHPGEIAGLVSWKFIRLLNPWPGTPNQVFNWTIALTYGLMLPFCLLGLGALLRHRTLPLAIPLISCLLMIAANTAIMYGDHRFRISIEPILVLTAVCGLEMLVRRATGIPGHV